MRLSALDGIDVIEATTFHLYWYHDGNSHPQKNAIEIAYHFSISFFLSLVGTSSDVGILQNQRLPTKSIRAIKAFHEKPFARRGRRLLPAAHCR